MERRLRKIDMAKELFSKYGYLFACPVCNAPMAIAEPATLQCDNRHSFDLARQGYVNLLTSSVKASKYDRELFAARLELNQQGFFSHLLATLQTHLTHYAPAGADKPLTILDAGCGEGSHLARVVAASRSSGQPVIGLGLDIAKDGIRLAARTYSGLLWCVADLARAPLQAKQWDVILDILSPANYAEFRRLLSPEGIVIKVFPGTQYLQELRTALYAGSKKATYQNTDSRRQFAQQFTLLAEEQVCYQWELTPSSLELLLQMTPLAWSAAERALTAVRQAGLPKITVDATIMVGKAEQ